MFKIRCQLRSSDFDTYGHLNQSLYHVLLEEGRVAFIFERLSETFQFVIARIELDYRVEVPQGEREVECGIELGRIGRSSFVLDQRLWRMDGQLSAEGAATFVAWDSDRRSSRPFTEAERKALEG